jgi:hypothetical protein
VLSPAGDNCERMTITESRRPGRSSRRGTRELLLGLFSAHHSTVHAAIRPGPTVAGPVPRSTEIPDRVICRQLDRASREYLLSRTQKRLVDSVSPTLEPPVDRVPGE